MLRSCILKSINGGIRFCHSSRQRMLLMFKRKMFIGNDLVTKELPSAYSTFFTMISGTPFRFFTTFIFCVAIAYLPLLLLHDLPLRDVAHRYAPMAEAFAQGDFAFAFHPRCQMLHTTVAGVISWLTGCNGFNACKTASFIFFLASAFPLFFLCRRIFPEHIARGAVLLLAVTPPLVEKLAITGVRDSAKMFVQLLMAHAIVCIIQQRDKFSGYIYAGLSCGLAVCVRNDLVLPACIVLFFSGMLDRTSHRWIYRSLIGVTVALLASFLEMSCNSFVCGYFIPGARYYDLFLNTFDVQPTFWPVIICAILPAYLLFAGSVYVASLLWESRIGKKLSIAAVFAALLLLLYQMVSLGIKEPERVQDFLNSILSGIYPVFSAFALIGIFFRIRNRQWKTEDTFLAILFGIYDMSVISQIIFHDKYLFVSSRYLIPALPLIFAWCWSGVIIVWKILYAYIGLMRRQWLHIVLVSAALTALLYCCYRSEINNRTRKKSVRIRQAINQLTTSIRAENKRIGTVRFAMMEYRSNTCPKVYFDCSSRYSIAAYCGGGSITTDGTQMDLLVTASENTEQLLKKKFNQVSKLEKIGNEMNGGLQKLQVWRVTTK